MSGWTGLVPSRFLEIGSQKRDSGLIMGDLELAPVVCWCLKVHDFGVVHIIRFERRPNLPPRETIPMQHHCKYLWHQVT